MPKKNRLTEVVIPAKAGIKFVNIFLNIWIPDRDIRE
jgi:hypothetical protein